MSHSDRDWTTRHLGEAARRALTAGMAASELWSLLLGVLEQRASRRAPADVRRQWESDRFVTPCRVDQRALNALDRHLLDVAREFEAIELSPLAPLGTCSRLALASQNKVVSTIRGTEVVSDPTNVLALESAVRLRRDPAAVVRLATSHRCVRAQPVPDSPGFAAHFRMFCLGTAGRERRDHGFVTAAIVEHVRTQTAILDRLEQHGYAFPGRRLTILASAERESHGRRIAEALGDLSPAVETLEHDYYAGLRFMISADTEGGEPLPLIDGGSFDWLGELASNRRLVFVASAIGSQIAAQLYRRPRASKA